MEFILSKTLLIIGAGAEQVPAYEIAKKRGLTVVASDISENAPAIRLADHFLKASTRDADATKAAVQKFILKHPIHGVMTIANDVPVTVAQVAVALGLKSISLESAIAASHKRIMKNLFEKNGVACPWNQTVRNTSELKQVLDLKKSRLVLKPVDGRGARGVLQIDKGSDLEWAFTESKRWGESGELLVEEFIEGPQLSTESFILDGKCYTAAIAERNYSGIDKFFPYIIEDGGTIPALLTDELRKKIDDLILKGARALGISEGPIKGDLVINKQGEPLIIELAARLSGGWFATHQIPSASGIDLVGAVISYSLGESVSVESLRPTKNNSTAIRYWFPPPGKIKQISGLERLREFPFVLSYGVFRGEGDVQPVVRMHPDRFGYVIVKGNNREESLKNVQTALDSVSISISDDE